MTCDVCGAPRERRVTVELPPLPEITRCLGCGLQFLGIVPAPATLRTLYQESYYDAEAGARFLKPLEWLVLFFRHLRARAIRRIEPGPARLLDVGCGRGELIELFGQHGWQAVGTQLSLTAATAARRRGLDVRVGELAELDLAPASFRVVTLFHVLEHFLEPRRELCRIFDLLEPGGILIVEVPDHGSFGARLLGRRALTVDYPHHLFFFDRATLSRLLAAVGFEEIARATFSLEYSPTTTLQNFLNLLPGRPNRLLDGIKNNDLARRLRRSPLTWLHFALAGVLAPAALLWSSLAMLGLPGNTLRFTVRRPAR